MRNPLGIRMVQQELDLAPDLTVAECVFLGLKPKRWGIVDRAQMLADTRALLSRVPIPFTVVTKENVNSVKPAF